MINHGQINGLTPQCVDSPPWQAACDVCGRQSQLNTGRQTLLDAILADGWRITRYGHEAHHVCPFCADKIATTDADNGAEIISEVD